MASLTLNVKAPGGTYSIPGIATSVYEQAQTGVLINGKPLVGGCSVSVDEKKGSILVETPIDVTLVVTYTPGAAGGGSIAPSVALDTGLLGSNFFDGIPSPLVDAQGGRYSIDGTLHALRLTNSASIGDAFKRDDLVFASGAVNQRMELAWYFPNGSNSNCSFGLKLAQPTGTRGGYLMSVAYNGPGQSPTATAYAMTGSPADVSGTLLGLTPCGNPGDGVDAAYRLVCERRVVSGVSKIRMRVYADASTNVLLDRSLTDTTSSLLAATNMAICGWNLATPPVILEALFSSLPDLVGNIVHEGDSITYGEASSQGAGTCDGTTYPAATMRALGLEWQGTNLGAGGQQIRGGSVGGTGMLINAPSRAAANKVAGVKNVVVVEGMYNDLYLGSPPAQVYADLKATYAAWRAAGYKVVAMTLPKAQHPAYPANMPSLVDQVNSAIRADPSSYDGLADVGGHWLLGETGSVSRRGYFNPSDRTHPVDGGYAIFGQIVAEAVRRLG